MAPCTANELAQVPSADPLLDKLEHWAASVANRMPRTVVRCRSC